MTDQEKEHIRKLLQEIGGLGVVLVVTAEKLSHKLTELTSTLKEHIK